MWYGPTYHQRERVNEHLLVIIATHQQTAAQSNTHTKLNQHPQTHNADHRHGVLCVVNQIRGGGVDQSIKLVT